MTETIQTDAAAVFVQRLTGHQGRLYAYIHALVGDADAAWDVLQETNLVLWQKMAEYDASRPFGPWAFTIAFHQMRAARLRSARDRLLFQDDATLQILSDDLAAREASQSTPEIEVALEQCMGNLEPGHRELVDRHYHQGEALKEIAASMDKKANAIAVTLHRVRLRLATCVEGVMGW